MVPAGVLLVVVLGMGYKGAGEMTRRFAPVGLLAPLVRPLSSSWAVRGEAAAVLRLIGSKRFCKGGMCFLVGRLEVA